MNFKQMGLAGAMVAALMVPTQIMHGQSAPAPMAGATTTSISPAAGEVVKLAQSGVGDDVVLAYVQSSQSPFNLGSDDILYLKDIGLSSDVITGMLNHDRSVPQTTQYNYNQQLYPSANPPPAVTPLPSPASAPVATDVTPPTYVSEAAPEDVGYFYSNLSPYGAWVQLDQYGWCWQPTVVGINRNWQPYCDSGHWEYTDAGWFWQSDYSWGWAPFHYGRWFHHDRVGWVWFPDRTWGPAWVTWRSSGDQCGWAPLPLHSTFVAGSGFRYNGVSVGVNFDFGLSANLFTFVALGDFREHDLVHRRLPPVQVNRFYNRTTIINNYVVEKNIVVNRGIPVDRVATATHTQIRPLPVHNVPSGARVEARSGPATAVYRHELQAPARTVPIVAQRVDDRHPVVQHLVAPSNSGQRIANPANNGQRPTVVNERPVAVPPPRSQNVNPRLVTPVQTREVSPTVTPTLPPPAHVDTPISPRVKAQPPARRMGSGEVPPVVVVEHPEPPKPTPPPKPVTVPGPTDFTPRSQYPATQAHALPPLAAPVAPAQQPSAPHIFPPRSQRTASEAHALPPIPQPSANAPAPQVIHASPSTPPQNPSSPPARDTSTSSPRDNGKKR